MLVIKDSLNLKEVRTDGSSYSFTGVGGHFTKGEWEFCKDIIENKREYIITEGSDSGNYHKIALASEPNESKDIPKGLTTTFTDYSSLLYLCEKFETHNDMSYFVNARLKEGFIINQSDINTLVVELTRKSPKAKKVTVKD